MDDDTVSSAGGDFGVRRDQAVSRVREMLRRAVRTSIHTQRSIERQNGFKPGYLSQVLQGHITLTVRHLVGILQALEIEPQTFFARLVEGSDDQPELSEIRQRLKRYDAAIDELTDKGLLGGLPADDDDER